MVQPLVWLILCLNQPLSKFAGSGYINIQHIELSKFNLFFCLDFP